ncbi:MAG: hypothetical protein EPN89_12965 [Methylovulum sp.]|nr:MAG: hypothetical protein EPN89_12965 [Methylovulum sp.]
MHPLDPVMVASGNAFSWLWSVAGNDYLEDGDGNDILYGDDKDGLITSADHGHDVVLGADRPSVNLPRYPPIPNPETPNTA